MFISSAPQLIEKINYALDNNDFEEIANHIHGFKTKCMMMGMAETKDLANTIEHLCRENSEEKIIKPNILNLIINIEKALNELRNYLKKGYI